ncbi:MAG: histidine phosphotransferase family protein [Tateyamaria sp.]|uniref:histidine phosphotransferase family protein n=1 Tax=Tateyamaria sp. TaxID=1929288 RepID=UPI0032A085EA
MGQSNVNLAALIGSRICHDLISPIGAINNGLELLGMSDDRESPEIDLITESVENASARIRFFRIAFGAPSNTLMGRSEVITILRDVTSGGRMTVAYGPMDDQPRWAVRLVFLAVLCLETSMPYGGRIEASCASGKWTITGHAPKTNADPAHWAVLSGAEPDGLAPAHVQFALLPAVADDAKRPVTCDASENTLTIRF